MPALISIVVVLLVLSTSGSGSARERLPHEPEMVEIPGGRFQMGCVSGSDCVDREHPVHEVRVEAFELSRYEVTFEEYDRFTDATGRERAADEGWGRGRRPVINVSWADAVALYEVAVGGVGAAVPAAERGGVRVCGAVGDGDGLQLGERDRPQPGQLPGLRQPVGR